MDRLTRHDWEIIHDAMAYYETMVEDDEPDPDDRVDHDDWVVRHEAFQRAWSKVAQRLISGR